MSKPETGSMIVWVIEDGPCTMEQPLLTRGGAAKAQPTGASFWECPNIPKDMGFGLFRWDGTVEAILGGVVWEGEWRRLRPSEALVLAAGKNPLWCKMDDLLDATMPLTQIGMEVADV